ncbi:MAG TPA: signal peptidase I [Solirubrobacteraceae bacterium]|nr:signal peptidase I [Solirubrobacteraceae bacterium]
MSPAPSVAAAPAEQSTAAEQRRGNAPLALAVVAVLALVALRAFVAEPFKIPSESMAPTLEPGDQALVTKLGGTPSRGDLVAFHAPRTSEVMLKRVVAVGGDTVGIEDGVLVVDGRRQREPYVADPDAIDSVYFGPVKVAPGALFVLGDNRANSEDSREFGAVPADRVIGRATARVWPPGRWGATR